MFLKVPPKGLLSCSDCHEETLTFIGQLYCPLEQPRSYNRVLYMFYCEVPVYVNTEMPTQFPMYETTISIVIGYQGSKCRSTDTW